MSDRRAALYLQIPAAYCRAFGGLRWAQYGEAVEFLDGPDAGRTFAFAAEIGQFLQGLLVPGRPCPAFGSALHLLYLIGLGRRAEGRSPSPRLDRLARGFRELGSPLRNAGALCARLYGEMPGVAEPPALSHVLELLNGGKWLPHMVISHPMLGTMDYAEQPPIDVDALEERMGARLRAMTDDEVRHWLTFGRGPMVPGPDLVPPTPSSGPAGSLADLEERPRLAGVTRLVERLDGALSLPPRRVELAELESDGYWDLTTRGAPEQILPMQFALDDEEFLRRFAERELLYFHRETPSRPAARELVLVLDQGVRTWGDVRLVLAGAAMALARQAARRKLAVRLATTGDEGGPVALDSPALGDVLESSDLSPNPARTLARLLREAPGSARDVVLLTHPRSLAEPEVVEAACRPDAGDPTRLFAVSVDSGGEVELSELRRGRPVPLGRCRVEFSEPAGPASPAPEPARVGCPAAWRGDVEPIPFPFRCRLLGPVGDPGDPGSRFIDFDQAGERILAIVALDQLCTFRVDGTDSEVLPRPMWKGEAIGPVKGVIGVVGGFVVVGGAPESPMLAHYDFPTRACTVHALDRSDGSRSLLYYPDLHTIAVRPAAPGSIHRAVDLAESGPGAFATWRAEQAVQRCRAGDSYPLPELDWVMPSGRSWLPLAPLPIKLDPQTGTLSYPLPYGRDPQAGTVETRSLIPMSDGQPALREAAHIVTARLGGDVLALHIAECEVADRWFISMARAAVIGSMRSTLDKPNLGRFALSRDGSRIARWVDHAQVHVNDVPGDRPPVFATFLETVWIHLASLGRSCLLVREHLRANEQPRGHILIRWDGERLEANRKDDAVRIFRQLGGAVAESVPAGSESWPVQAMRWAWMRHRFHRLVCHGELKILLDGWNHLAVLGRHDRLIAMFFVGDDEFAAWMPDGTRLGTSRLIGGARTKAASERIAAALRAAERGEGGRR